MNASRMVLAGIVALTAFAVLPGLNATETASADTCAWVAVVTPVGKVTVGETCIPVSCDPDKGVKIVGGPIAGAAQCT